MKPTRDGRGAGLYNVPFQIRASAQCTGGGFGVNWHGLDLRWAYANLLPGIYRHTQCFHLAYDVLHDALVRFALTRNRDQIDQPHAYLRTVVRNVLADTYREAARFVPLAVDGHPTAQDGRDLPTLHEQALSPAPEQLADLQQRLDALQRIIDCLPARCREVFWLYRVEGYTQPEIADRLAISLNMVERHIMRALVDLRTAHDIVHD